MEIDIDLPKPLQSPYSNYLISPVSKKKRKLSTSQPNNQRTKRRTHEDTDKVALPQAPLTTPDIIMATETLHMHDTTMRDTTSLIDNDKRAKQQQRKVRFTMGPRADCLKCKLGIKGHYSHFD
ncbi:hypothetical protein E3Q22_00736 [Wallemia mellicola]|uniref:Uncharacterized protein n=2 Tax=Wallemia mellicola TaxID=1708541 RepID=A0A4T0MHA7_9BASI|nr:hypothetical protein E3Q23_00467 [Wallemia mellicola]TIB81806.1 hypothetical protein E3Q22_00736 [Wallemia mellicola]TIC16766.1 hypothetical protein E3Q15_00904 [Wallemia mellicola]TIC52518.1 hypothetical protein E3Q05_02750 [Wallemia mellicola]TIC68468.1 hypothetical protein E3Q01_00892 [Wallemia mellicola]